LLAYSPHYGRGKAIAAFLELFGVLTANKARLVFTALAVANLTQLNTLITTAG